MGRYKCGGCGTIMEVILANGELVRTPLVLDFTSVDGADPEISSDFIEAQKCYNVEAYKAAVVMCRRAIEGMAMSMDAIGRTLLQKIEDVHQRGLISKRNFDIATQIRQFGNYGAHLNNDLLGGITRDDTRTILEITHHLLRDAYEVPQSIDKLKKRLGK
jgi:hypothetical protein